MEGLNEFQELQDKVVKWSNETFGEKSYIEGAIRHLQEEAKHLENNPYSPENYADVMILIMSIAAKAGFTMDDLFLAVEAKHTINLSRLWNKPDERGIIRHR